MITSGRANAHADADRRARELHDRALREISERYVAPLEKRLAELEYRLHVLEKRSSDAPIVARPVA
jgi:hypothetical protein